MGLAASQARFLGITARKNSCELKSMQIAQEKLSITNKLAQISEDYQNSLDATRLVWDSEYITDGSVFDVSYELLMQPSLLNSYSPQLLTNQKNQIVLDAQYASAAKTAGIWQTGGTTRSLANFQTYLKALNSNGILNKLDYDNMISVLSKTTNAATQTSSYYRPDNGLGGEVQEKLSADAMNLPTLKKYIRELTNPNSDYMNELRETYGTSGGSGTPTNYDKAVELSNLLNFSCNKHYETLSSSGSGSVITSAYPAATFGEWCEKDYGLTISDGSFDFADLLEKEITLSTNDENKMKEALPEFINQMYKIMSEFFAIDPSSVDQDYLNFAFDQICRLNSLTWDSNTKTASASGSLGYFSTSDAASKHTSLIKNGASYQISLSNVVKGILTYFEKAVEGFDSGYSVESTDQRTVKNSNYVTKDPEYYYFINNPATNGFDDEALNLLDYYSQMFNQLCANGWTENTLVSEPENLKNMLKNGTLFTSTLSDDGNFYQGAYTSNNFIAEVADEDAITRAEAEYKTQQLKLSAKEEELDISLQEVDAELAALTTEYDSVKQMISKGIEKGFSTLGG